MSILICMSAYIIYTDPLTMPLIMNIIQSSKVSEFHMSHVVILYIAIMGKIWVQIKTRKSHIFTVLKFGRFTNTNTSHTVVHFAWFTKYLMINFFNFVVLKLLWGKDLFFENLALLNFSTYENWFNNWFNVLIC